MASTPQNRFDQDERRRDADHIGFYKYRNWRWAWIAGALALVSLLGYALIDQEPRPNGGSWYGYTLGTIGLGLIVWLSLLGVRKRRMTSGAWSLKAWTSAHIYLGLALIVVGTLHTGFQIGWNVHTLAYVLMLLVIFSGIYGVWAYIKLPEALSDNREEMTREDMMGNFSEIDRKLKNTAQPLGVAESDLIIAAIDQDVFAGGLWGRLTGSYPRCATSRAVAQLPNISSRDPEAAQQVLQLLEERKHKLTQFRRHLRIKALLEVWLFIHIPVTIALLAALFAHVVSVFYYW